MPLVKPTEKENLYFIKKKRRSCKQGPRSSFQKRGGRSTSFESQWGGGREVGVGVVGLWTFKMVYLVPTQYFLIELQLINHYFNSLTERKKGQQQKKYYHAQQHRNFRVFHSLSKLVRSLLAAVQDLFLTIVLLPSSCRKGPFSPAMDAGFTSRSLQIGTNSFIMLC